MATRIRVILLAILATLACTQTAPTASSTRAGSTLPAAGTGTDAGTQSGTNDQDSSTSSVNATGTDTGTGSGTGTDSTANQNPGGAPAPGPTPPSTIDGASLTYDQFAKPIIDAHCVSCHGVPATGGAPSTFTLSVYGDAGGLLGVHSMASDMAMKISQRLMPPGGFNDATAAASLLAWLQAGAPNAAPTPTPPAPVNPPTPTPPTPTPPTPPTPAPPGPPPGISITDPASLGETLTNDHFNVQVSVSNAANGATFDLYETANQGATTGGVQVVAGQAVSSPSYDWDTTSIASGSYYIYAILHSGGSSYSTSSTGTIAVEHPTVSLTGVFAGAGGPTNFTANTNTGVVLQSAAASLTYSAASNDGESLTYQFAYSDNDGSTWNSFTCASPTTASCTWDTSGLAEDTHYRVKVTVTDTDGGSATAASSSSFGISAGISGQNYTYANYFHALTTSSCLGASCHSSGGAGYGSFQPDSLSGAQSAASNIIFEAVENSFMPKTGGPLSATDKIRVQLWVWGGAK